MRRDYDQERPGSAPPACPISGSLSLPLLKADGPATLPMPVKSNSLQLSMRLAFKPYPWLAQRQLPARSPQPQSVSPSRHSSSHTQWVTFTTQDPANRQDSIFQSFCLINRCLSNMSWQRALHCLSIYIHYFKELSPLTLPPQTKIKRHILRCRVEDSAQRAILNYECQRKASSTMQVHYKN